MLLPDAPRTLADVWGLDRRLTVRQVERLATDSEVFALLVVGEAILKSVPGAVSEWLRCPAVAGEWHEELILQAGRHQVSWWICLLDHGPDHRRTIALARRATLLSDRCEQAAACVKGLFHRPRAGRDARAAGYATKRLKQEHPAEVEELTEQLTEPVRWRGSCG